MDAAGVLASVVRGSAVGVESTVELGSASVDVEVGSISDEAVGVIGLAVAMVGEAGDGAAIAAAPLVSGVAASEALGDAGKGVGSRVGRRLRLDAGVAVAGTITGEGVLE